MEAGGADTSHCPVRDTTLDTAGSSSRRTRNDTALGSARIQRTSEESPETHRRKGLMKVTCVKLHHQT